MTVADYALLLSVGVGEIYVLAVFVAPILASSISKAYFQEKFHYHLEILKTVNNPENDKEYNRGQSGE